MTASIQGESLSPSAQFQQLFSSVSSFCNSLCENSDDAFCRVKVSKKDENGNIKFYNVIDKATSQTTRTSELTYIEDVKTGELYMDEGWFTVASKCALVALGMPFYTLGKMAWHALRTPLEITAIAVKTLPEVGRNLAAGKLYEGVSHLRIGLIQSSEKIGDGLYEIVKSPIFGLGAALAGLYGVVKPFRGRSIEAIIENAWLNGASYQNDFRNIPPRSGENCLEAFFKDVMELRPFYLAHCFQVRGNTHDPRVIVLSRSPA